MECYVLGMAWFQVGATCSSKPYFTTRLVDGLVQQSCAAGAVTWSGPLCCPGCTEQLTWPALDGDSHATRLWLWQAHAGRKANCQMVACVTDPCTGWGIRAGASFLHVLAVFVPYSCRLLHACCAPHLLLGSHSVHVSWYASCGPWVAAHASLAWSALLPASSRLETLGRTAAVLCAGHTAADRRASLLLDPWLWLLPWQLNVMEGLNTSVQHTVCVGSMRASIAIGSAAAPLHVYYISRRQLVGVWACTAAEKQHY
jgi:hypothetical protein